MQVRQATAVAAHARHAVGPAWRALVQVAVGPDPAPGWRWRSPWRRRAGTWGLAVVTAAATAASVVLLAVYAKAGVAVSNGSGQAALGSRVQPDHLAAPPVSQVAALHGQSLLMAAVLIGVALAGVAPLTLVAVRPLLGWRIGWLVLLAAPWTGVHWLVPDNPAGFGGIWPWDPAQVAVLVMVFVAAGIQNERGALWWMWALTLLPWWLLADGTHPGLTGLTGLTGPDQLRREVLGTILFTAAAVAADALGGRSRARIALAGAAERAEAEAIRRTALEERAKIARELHDVVAHHLSLIAVRSEAAPYRLSRLADDARAEFGELGGTAREALVEMRRLLGVLRTGEAAEHAPQPRLEDLPGLVDAARDAGLAVGLSQCGPLDRLPAAVGGCAYRVVQESLSNAGRHAPGTPVSVSVAAEPPVVKLKITNGPVAARNGAAAHATTVPRVTLVNGHGLAGMRERVTLLGGTFSAGPAADGGFEVAAELPIGDPA